MNKIHISFQTANSKFGFLGTVLVQKFEKSNFKILRNHSMRYRQILRHAFRRRSEVNSYKISIG